ncbi:hypothetical protein WME89_04380 [Sorangium sp. So ce321]|uniref:hypothetical protein n=1 Tax=Sorangium sp. So ce321 TaxID=3133300 RepID=UPI003F643D7F
MSSNKDSDDIRQYLPDLESIRREADPAVAERKLQQALNNPELDRALSEMQQQKPTGQPLFQFPVVPALARGQAVAPGAVVPQHGAAAPRGAGPPPLPHGAAVPQGAMTSQHGAITPQHGAAVPLYGGAAAAAPHGAAVPRGAVVPQSVAAPQGGAMAPSQWADRGLPPIDKALLPSSLLPVTPPPVATPDPPAGAQATPGRRRGMPWWVIALLAVLALSMPFVTLAIMRRQTPGNEKEPAPPSSGAPARSTQAPPEASELLPPSAPAPPEEVKPSLDDVATGSGPPAPALPAPARPARAAPRLPQAPVTPLPAEKPLDQDWMQ